MLHVTPIGSCRIAGPLQRAQDRLGIATNKTRVYGYCHSSGEAVQMARFLRGELKPDPATWPLISRSTNLEALSAQDHTPSDLYVIELSSAKRLTVDGVFVQLNYVTKAFADFFADDDRARAFWARAEDGNQARIDRFLKKQAVLDTDRALLRRLRLSLTTPDELRTDIATLKSLLPRLLIVTHANALKLDGMPIGTRAAFINMVKDAGRAVGVRVYDPTKRMLEMGQIVALADHSAGLAHYSDSFADAICDEWLELAIAPAIDDLVRDGGPGVVSDILAPHITALTGRIPFAALLGRLAELAKNGVPVAPVASVLEVAKRSLDPELGPVQTAYLLGQFNALADALATSETLPPPDRLLIYAKDAPATVAQDILMRGLAAFPDAAPLAEQLGEKLLCDNTIDVPPKLRPVILRHIAPIDRIKLCMAYDWNFQIAAQDLAAEDVTDVTAHLAMAQGRSVAISFLSRWLVHNTLPEALSVLLGQWCAFDTADRGEKVRFCCQVLAIDPQNAIARGVLRDMRRLIRTEMRKMADTSDRAGLDGLAQVNALLPDPIPEVDLFRARACFTSENYADAIKIGRAAAETLPDNLSIWVLLMRAAHRTQQNSLCARFAERVITLATPDTVRFAQEAAARVGNADLVSHG